MYQLLDFGSLLFLEANYFKENRINLSKIIMMNDFEFEKNDITIRQIPVDV